MRFFFCLLLLLAFCKLAWQLFWRVRRVVVQIHDLQEAGEFPVSADELQRGESEQSCARCAEMNSYGATWSPWDAKEAASHLIGSHLARSVRFGSGARCYGPLRVELDQETFLIFDLGFAVSAGRLYESMFQTVGTHCAADLDVPHFYIRPYMAPRIGLDITSGMTCVADSRLSHYDLVDSINLLNVNYVGESLLSSRARAFFETDFASQSLLPFIRDRNWIVEWADHRLAVYQLDRLVPVAELAEFAADVRGLVPLLRQAADAYVTELDQRIERAASRIAGCTR